MLKQFYKKSMLTTFDCQKLLGSRMNIYSPNASPHKYGFAWRPSSLKNLDETLHQDSKLKISGSRHFYYAFCSRKYTHAHTNLEASLTLENSYWLEDSYSIYLRSFTRYDRVQIFNLLSFLPSIYPKGYSWLDNRLDDVLSGAARCTLAVTPWDVAGVTIETPKGARRLKLSTIYVNPRFRGLGIGASLLRHCKSQWEREELTGVHVTADTRRLDALLPLLTNHGFSVTAIDKERYGPGRDEMIFNWEPK